MRIHTVALSVLFLSTVFIFPQIRCHIQDEPPKFETVELDEVGGDSAPPLPDIYPLEIESNSKPNEPTTVEDAEPSQDPTTPNSVSIEPTTTPTGPTSSQASSSAPTVPSEEPSPKTTTKPSSGTEPSEGNDATYSTTQESTSAHTEKHSSSNPISSSSSSTSQPWTTTGLPILPPLDPEEQGKKLPTFAIVTLSIMISFAGIFTVFFFLRRHCIRKRKEDRKRLLRGSISSEGFFYGDGSSAYSDKTHDRI